VQSMCRRPDEEQQDEGAQQDAEAGDEVVSVAFRDTLAAEVAAHGFPSVRHAFVSCA
jgi:hypothetical protein